MQTETQETSGTPMQGQDLAICSLFVSYCSFFITPNAFVGKVFIHISLKRVRFKISKAVPRCKHIPLRGKILHLKSYHQQELGLGIVKGELYRSSYP